MFEQFHTPALFLTLQHVLQVVLSFYALRHSYVAITNLRKYEETTKKAAEWSDEAQKQLDKTRTTMGAGAITVRFPPYPSPSLLPLLNLFTDNTLPPLRPNPHTLPPDVLPLDPRLHLPDPPRHHHRRTPLHQKLLGSGGYR